MHGPCNRCASAKDPACERTWSRRGCDGVQEPGAPAITRMRRGCRTVPTARRRQRLLATINRSPEAGLRRLLFCQPRPARVLLYRKRTKIPPCWHAHMSDPCGRRHRHCAHHSGDRRRGGLAYSAAIRVFLRDDAAASAMRTKIRTAAGRSYGRGAHERTLATSGLDPAAGVARRRHYWLHGGCRHSGRHPRR